MSSGLSPDTQAAFAESTADETEPNIETDTAEADIDDHTQDSITDFSDLSPKLQTALAELWDDEAEPTTEADSTTIQPSVKSTTETETITSTTDTPTQRDKPSNNRPLNPRAQPFQPRKLLSEPKAEPTIQTQLAAGRPRG